MADVRHPIHILGGGPAGLATAWYAQQHQVPFELFEAAPRVGGNCTTLNHQQFLFDSGAHRLHDKDLETTQMAQALLGDELEHIQVPSQIFREGKYIDFPLSPFNLLRYLGLGQFVAAGWQMVRNKLAQSATPENFQELAVSAYGKRIADLFLLHYTEKLWGKPADELSVEVAGKRLKGLNLKTFLLEVLRGTRQKTEHLDGAFYYPKYGIGSLFEAMQKQFDPAQVHLSEAITGIEHRDQRILGIATSQGRAIDVAQLVSSLPLGLLLQLLRPAPPEEVLQLARSIRFRNIVLVGFFLDKPSVNPNGSMYFPSSEFPFTRVYEPRNRSTAMAPEGKTSLIAEIPCQSDDLWWTQDASHTVHSIQNSLVAAGFFQTSEVIDAITHPITHAYPVLETGYAKKVLPLMQYLDQFENLHLTGRNGLFAYTHIHDHMQNGRQLVQKLLAGK
ncbi:MAG: protoporphyrinogen/coproporphyrinogen oxidase [Salibacteraceae bacterium]